MLDQSLEPKQPEMTAPTENLPPSAAADHEHFAHFYTREETLVESVATYVLRAVRDGAAAIVIATAQHVEALDARWKQLQFDTAAAIANGQLLVLDAAQTLAKFMVDGAPDPQRFMESVGQAVGHACERYGSTAAFGEMVTLLWADGKPTAAVKLESLWNELAGRYPLTLFCGYALRDCTGDDSDAAFEEVCAAHTRVVPAESYAPSSSEQQRRAIAQLQRKALALEMRLARDKEIKRSMAYMAGIIENSNDAIIGKTLEGIIQSWNAGAQRLFGYRPEEAIGKSITLIIPPDRLEEEERILETLRRGERIEHFETARVTKEGRRIDISLTVSPIRDDSGIVIGASKIARDITDRKRAETLLREAHASLQSRTAELARFNAVAVGRESHILALKREVNELRSRLGEAPEYSFDGTKMETGLPALAYSRALAESERPAEELVPLRSILLTEQLQQRASRLPDYETESRALAALVEALANNPHGILQVLSDKVLEVLRTGSAGLSLLTKDGQRFYWAAISGQWSPHAGGGTPRDFGPCGDVLDHGAALLFTHWERRYPYLAAATPLAEEGLLVPFRIDGQAVGTIWAIAHDQERKFDAEDLRVLESLARFASAAYQAVNNLSAVEEQRAALSLLEDAVQARTLAEESLAKLRDSEQRLALHAESLVKLNEWSSRVWRCRDLREGLAEMLHAAIELLGASKGNVQLLNDEGMLTIEAQRGFDREFLEHFRQVSDRHESACGRALRSREQIIIEDVELDPTFAPLRPIARAAGFRAVVSTPLISGEGTLQGVLSTHFAAPRRPSDSELSRLALYLRHASDFIHRCKIEAVLRRSEEALREASHRKDEFLALLAHELRNPLAPIRYALAANRKAERTPEQRRWANEVMERQVAHMSRLLDDLLDISRITRGTLELKKAPAELTSVLSTAIETARPLVDSKHHRLSLDFPTEAVRLEADAVRLAQVFSNLLINAAKYTDPCGEIHLSARRENGEVVVAVRDNGIGISPEMMPRLFTMFAQGEGVQGRTEGGLGVGLALVRGVVALHGGSIHAHSDGPGRGSTFTVRLPIGERTAEETQLDSLEDPAAAVGMRILVVDDNQDAADTCAALLKLSGHHVQTAYTGRSALDLAASFRPHAMLLDIGLPDLDGYALAKRIRATTWGRRTLLIAVTGWGQNEDRRRAQEAGFDHHLAKPVSAEALEAALQTVGVPGGWRAGKTVA
jgi:PAS domain S-box-containing protein